MDLALYNLNSGTILNWVTAFCLFEIPLALFYISTCKNKNIDKNDDCIVRNWYSGKNISIWNVVIQDFFYAFGGIILAVNLFKFLVLKHIVQNIFIVFIIVFVFIQIFFDSLLAFIVSSWSDNSKHYWITYFKNYIKKTKYNALIGDMIYVIVWSLTYYFITINSHNIFNFDVKLFIITLFIFLLSVYSVRKSL